MKSDEEKGTAAARRVGCPSALELDAFLLAPLDRQADDSMVRHVQSCRYCQQTVAEQRQARQIFESEIFPDSVGAVTEQVSNQGRVAAKLASVLQGLFARPSLALASAAMLLLAAGVWQFIPKERPYIGVKGGADADLAVEVFCKRGERVFRVSDGDALLPDDMLRFAPTILKKGFLMIVSIEEGGTVNLYYPVGGGKAALIDQSTKTLPGSIVLDESKGAERLFVVFSEKPFNFEIVARAVQEGLQHASGVEELRRLPLNLQQASLLFHKGVK